MPRDDDLLGDAPEQVLRLQELLAARSRLAVVKLLVAGPLPFSDLRDRLPGLSLAGIRAALADLITLGYVCDDSDPSRQRRSVSALYTLDRDRVSRDAAELLLYLSR